MQEQQLSLDQSIDAKYTSHHSTIAMNEQRLLQEKFMSLIIFSTKVPVWLQFIPQEASRRRKHVFRMWLLQNFKKRIKVSI